MTDSSPPTAGHPTPRDLIAVTDEQLTAAAEALGAVINDIKAGRFGAVREMAPLVSSLRKALEATLHERARIEKLSPAGPGAPECALDLGAARHEIGRRLACLRAARDGEGLSGQPD